MKILLVHNFYGSSAPSGENTAFEAEVHLLRTQGHSVVEFTRNSDEILSTGLFGTMKGAVSTVWNPFSLRKLTNTLRKVKPDVVHVHNTFPLLSPSVIYATRTMNIPTVMTLHNYRMGCASATALRDNQPCTLCLDQKSVLPALRYGCYRNSRIATAPIAGMIAVHRALDSWRRNVDAFIVLTEFQKEKMIQFGIPEISLYVKPHFFEQPPVPVPWRKREPKAVFIGRLYEAKGIHVLVEAWKKWGAKAPLLEIIGDGPMKKDLMRSIEQSDVSGRIIFKGNVSRDEAMRLLSTAKLLILPSICYEGFPMVVQEAYALGVPVAASDIGSLPYIVSPKRTGALFKTGNAEDLLATVRALLNSKKKLEAIGKLARREFDERYTAKKNYHTLIDIYNAAADHRGVHITE